MNNMPFCWPYLMPPPNFYNNRRRMQGSQIFSAEEKPLTENQSFQNTKFENDITNDTESKENDSFVIEGLNKISDSEFANEEKEENILPEVFQSKPQINYKLKL